MQNLYQVVMKEELHKQLKCLLCKCPYGYHEEANRKGTKPEYLLQDYLMDALKKSYKVKKEFPIDVSNLVVSPSIHEATWEIDLVVKKEDFYCLAEIKYDEEYKEGDILKSTNPKSEDEILRDAYKLQCLRQRNNKVSYLIVFATNKASHWEKFTSIPSGLQTINYNGKEEKFRLLKSYPVVWNEAIDSKYRYCIIRVD